jgi:uncharacterized membrane protein
MSSQRFHPWRDFTNFPFEVFIFLLTILPFLVLVYFYPVLPDRVPLFVKLNGEVAVWAQKSVLAVFRVSLMALVTQIVCLLMKYGPVQSITIVSSEISSEQAKLHQESLRLNAALWDWFRWTVAFKMSAESVDTVFLSLERFKFLSRPTFVITAVAAATGVAGALFYGYRLLVLKNEMKTRFGGGYPQNAVDVRRVYGGFLYFNPSDSAFFVSHYVFNFANKWAWVFLACIVTYPLLVFLPV